MMEGLCGTEGEYSSVNMKEGDNVEAKDTMDELNDAGCHLAAGSGRLPGPFGDGECGQ
ncbi:hypothetical protein J28TS4_23750 [Paenibacillus lautus]|nr:hypothetical protein J28TS4_23750 [Paenibacillus lautus]